MNLNDRLLELEDEYDLELIPHNSPSMELLKFVRKEFNLTPIETKDFLKQQRVLYSGLGSIEIKEKAKIFRELGVDVEIHKTGDKYLKNYDPQVVEKTLRGFNFEKFHLSDFFVSSTGGIIHERNGFVSGCIIEDDDLAKGCVKYLLEKGQYKDELSGNAKLAIVEYE